MYRREWRQQVLVLTLLTLAVTASVGVAVAAYSIAPAADRAVIGAGSHAISISGDDSEVLRTDAAAARAWFGTSEVITHREVPAPGLFEPVDYRAQDPQGPLGGPRLDLVAGRYPAAGEVAVSDGIADLLDLDTGGSLALDGVPRTIVGIVENPGDLADEFVLLPATEADDADEVTILVDATAGRVQAFHVPGDVSLAIRPAQTNADVLAAVGILVLATVGLLLVALVASASFVVVAQRRMRQLGMLSAIGATERQLRVVTLANGAFIGGCAALLGAVIGVGGWLLLAPSLEDTLGFRLDALDVPWWVVASAMLLALVTGTAAAWWPARTVARVPTVRALSGRPPEPRPARRAAALAGVAAAVGAGCLVVGGDLSDATSVSWTDVVLIAAGTVAVAMAVLFACPPAIRLLASRVGRFPVAVRLAVGDLARYRARASAALAAVSLALGIAVTVTAAATAAQTTDALGNLAEGQVLVRVSDLDGPFVPEAGELDRLDGAVRGVTGAFDDPVLTSLDVAIDPHSAPSPTFEGRLAMSLVAPVDDGWTDRSLLYVATPQLLEPYGYDLAATPADTVVITREKGEQLGILGAVGPDREAGPDRKVETVTDAEPLEPGFTSLPGTFVTTAALAEHGWATAPSGRWLVETATPPTSEQLAAAREAAAAVGLTVEVRDRRSGLATLRSGATAVGSFLALGVLAMTVGLVRSESGRDLRILTATGATSRTRRTITAATAGALALLGAALGITGAYLGLTAGFARDLGALLPLPVANLVVIALGLPLLATVAGWLVSGRTIADVGRQPLE